MGCLLCVLCRWRGHFTFSLFVAGVRRGGFFWKEKFLLLCMSLCVWMGMGVIYLPTPNSEVEKGRDINVSINAFNTTHPPARFRPQLYIVKAELACEWISRG